MKSGKKNINRRLRVFLSVNLLMSDAGCAITVRVHTLPLDRELREMRG